MGIILVYLKQMRLDNVPARPNYIAVAEQKLKLGLVKKAYVQCLGPII